MPLGSAPCPCLPAPITPQVIYLGLVSFLDIRGGELLPPPPEAYIP